MSLTLTFEFVRLQDYLEISPSAMLKDPICIEEAICLLYQSQKSAGIKMKQKPLVAMHWKVFVALNSASIDLPAYYKFINLLTLHF